MTVFEATATAGEWRTAARSAAAIAGRRSAGPSWERAARLTADGTRVTVRAGWIEPVLTATVTATCSGTGDTVLELPHLIAALRPWPKRTPITLAAITGTRVEVRPPDAAPIVLEAGVDEPGSVGWLGPLGAASSRPVFTAGRADLVAAIARTARTAGTDFTTPVLAAIAITLGVDELELATTDRYRLTVTRVRADVAPVASGQRLLLPAAALAKVAPHFTGDRLSLDLLEGQAPRGANLTAVVVRDASLRLVQHLVDGPDLPYAGLFKPARGATAVVAAADLSALVRAAAQAGPADALLLAAHGNRLTGTVVADSDVGTTFTAPLQASAGDFRVAIAPRFLADLAATFAGDPIELALAATRPQRSAVQATVAGGDASALRMLIQPFRMATQHDSAASAAG